MPDIIVTTPKSRMKEAAREAAEAREEIDTGGEAWYFRNVGRARIAPGERIYYVEDGYVRGYAVVAWVGEENELTCDTTGRRFGPGRYAMMDARSWVWIDPIPMRGFQGWRYVDPFMPLVVFEAGTWCDDKPVLDYA